MTWGKGWEVGIRKEMWRQDRVNLLASEILATECGTRHETGSRTDLCPKCQAHLSSRMRDTPE